MSLSGVAGDVGEFVADELGGLVAQVVEHGIDRKEWA